jgi:hypothetical protein
MSSQFCGNQTAKRPEGRNHDLVAHHHPEVAAVFAMLLLATSPLRAQAQGVMDHAALASSYQEEAKADEAKAAMHQKQLAAAEAGDLAKLHQQAAQAAK